MLDALCFSSVYATCWCCMRCMFVVDKSRDNFCFCGFAFLLRNFCISADCLRPDCKPTWARCCATRICVCFAALSAVLHCAFCCAAVLSAAIVSCCGLMLVTWLANAMQLYASACALSVAIVSVCRVSCLHLLLFVFCASCVLLPV